LLLAQLHPVIPVVLTFLSLPRVIIASHFSRKRFQILFRRTPEARMVGYMVRLLGSRETIKEIRAYELDGYLARRLESHWNAWINENYGISQQEQLIQLSLDLLAGLTTGGIWWYALSRGLTGAISVGSVFLYFQAANDARIGLGSVFRAGGLF